jgi:putative chitinase
MFTNGWRSKPAKYWMRLNEIAPKKKLTAPAVKSGVKPASALSSIKLEASSLGSHLEDAAKAAGIIGIELAAFLAQCKVETASFTTLEEQPNPYMPGYEPHPTDPSRSPPAARALGNTQQGDGDRFKGRGYIQLSGRYNYSQFAKKSGIPVDKNPKLLLDPTMAAKASIWFWKNKVKPVVSNIKNVAAVTRVVNGRAMLGLEKRTINFKTYMKRLTTPQIKKQGKVK